MRLSACEGNVGDTKIEFNDLPAFGFLDILGALPTVFRSNIYSERRMITIRYYWNLAATGLCVAFIGFGAATPATGNDVDLKKMLDGYTGSFNKHDPAAVSEYWTPGCVHVDNETGAKTEGRVAIQHDLTEVFKTSHHGTDRVETYLLVRLEAPEDDGSEGDGDNDDDAGSERVGDDANDAETMEN